MRSKIFSSLLVVLLMAGAAIAGHRTRTNDVTATFDVQRTGHNQPRTCTGMGGETYVERTDTYEGEMYSDDPRLAGRLVIVAHTLIDTTTGDGITVSKLRLFDPATGNEKFNGGYSATLDRFHDEGFLPVAEDDEFDHFAEGFWFSKVKGVGGEGDDNEGEHPQGLLAANFHVNISESTDPSQAGRIEPGGEGRQREVGDGKDSGELGQETQAEEWDDEPEEGEDNDEDNPAIVQTGSCTDFSDWDNDWVG